MNSLNKYQDIGKSIGFIQIKKPIFKLSDNDKKNKKKNHIV